MSQGSTETHEALTDQALPDQAGVPPLLLAIFPFLRWWPKVTRRTLSGDFLAGLTGAIVVLPQGVAFATIAGMPPEYGLYAGIVPAIVAALWGSSWHLVSGPTTAASLVLYSSLSAFADPATPEYVSLALTLTVMVGILQLVMGLARLGTLVNFISHSVVLGFTAGAAILIAANQIKHFFGIHMPRGLLVYETLHYVYEHVAEIDPYIATVGGVTLASGLLSKRFLPRVPYMIVAMVIGSVAGVGLQQFAGLDASHVPTVGRLPSHLPPLSAPDFRLSTLKDLSPAAFAVTLFALTEAVSIARSLAVRAQQRLDGNQEFIGQGLSNIAGSFFSGYVATGSFNRSALNYEAGAKTPLAAVFAGSLLAGVIVLVAPLAAYLPNAAMAAILFLVAWGLIDFHHIRRTAKASRREGVILGVTFLATLLLELEFAILAGVLLSLVIYLTRTSRPRMLSRVPDPASKRRTFVSDDALPECPQLKIVRVDGSLFFGAVAHVSDLLASISARKGSQRHVAISATGINFIDVAGAELLAQEAEERRLDNGGLYLIRPKPSVLKVLRKGGYLKEIGSENIFHGKTAAIQSIVERLDPEICAQCTRRIFKECSGQPDRSSVAQVA